VSELLGLVAYVVLVVALVKLSHRLDRRRRVERPRFTRPPVTRMTLTYGDGCRFEWDATLVRSWTTEPLS
jgi:hypothetical protein